MQDLETLTSRAEHFARLGLSAETKRAYARSWRGFALWCRERDLCTMPAAPSTIAAWIAWLADHGRRVAGIEQALAAVVAAHRVAGHSSPRDAPEVSQTLAGIRRSLHVAQDHKAAITVDELRVMAAVANRRDRALLLVGFSGGFRRSELVDINAEDIEWRDEGMVITVRSSKTDQEGAGRQVAIPNGTTLCPVTAMGALVQNQQYGPVFVSRRGVRLSGGDVARIVKTLAKAAGLDPGRFSGHSLRAGLATAAAKAGKSEREIMKTTGHKSEAMVRRYIRDAELFEALANDGIGL